MPPSSLRPQAFGPVGALAPGVPVVAVQALPVLAVSAAGLRRVGLVVLDRRGRVRAAKLLYLRRFKTLAERLADVRREVEALLYEMHVASVVLEAPGPRRPRLLDLRGVLADACQGEGAWLREMTLAGAMCLLGADDREHLVLGLAVEYRELAARLDLTGRKLFGPRDKARENRPLVDAFLLAHAVAIEAQRASAPPAAAQPPPRYAATFS